MSKKKKSKDIGSLVCECGNADLGQVRVSFDDTDPLAKSLKYGAQLLEDNDRLRAELAGHKQCWSKDDQIDYWKNRRRRFWGSWHVTVKVDLTPWSWSLRPQFPKWADRKIGVLQFWWLFLCIEATEA